MIHEILPVGPLQCNCSVIGDETSREAIVIDPGDDIDDILALVAKHHLRVKQLVITHAHIDHVGGATKLRAATGAPILLNQNDYALLKMLDMQAAWIGMRSPGKSTSIRALTMPTLSRPALSPQKSFTPPATPRAASASTSLPKASSSLVTPFSPGALAAPTFPAAPTIRSCGRFTTVCWRYRMTQSSFPDTVCSQPSEKRGIATRFCRRVSAALQIIERSQKNYKSALTAHAASGFASIPAEK